MTQTSPFLVQNPVTKSFDFSPWGGLEGFLEASKAGATGYNNRGSQFRFAVPDVFRAVDMTAVAISSLPFDIIDDAGNVLDTSSDWQNRFGGMKNPQRLIYSLASSLCGGAAYVIPTIVGKYIGDLQFVPPNTVLPQYGLDGIFEYNYISQFGKTATYKPEEMLHFFLPDSDVEQGPAKAHPLGTAAASAARILAMNNTINVTSERGFIAPTLLMVEGMVQEGERAKTERWWNLWLRGALTQVAKIINAKTMSIQKVGAGMDELKTVFVELKADAKQEIAQAFGIPAGLFMPDKAYATEYDALIRTWYSASVFVTIYQTIQETFTEQLFEQFGATMQFKPETIDAFQEDEMKKADAFAKYTAAGVKPSIAAQLLGLELPAGMEYEELDPEDEAEDMAEGETETDGAETETEDDAEEMPMVNATMSLTPDEMKDLALWYSKAVSWHAKGKSAQDWECKHLREDIAAPIRAKLKTAASEAEIKAAFEMPKSPAVKDDAELKALIDAINNQTGAPTMPPINVNITANLTPGEPAKVDVHVPEQKAQESPMVYFNPVIQPSDVVVQNNTPIENNVTVQPAENVNEVTVNVPPAKKTTKAKLTRNPDGTLEIRSE